MSRRYQTLLLFGPPGVGKGTQGAILGRIPGFFHLSSGDVFRSIDINSAVGKTFLDYSSRGELVPDDITIQLWKRHLDARVVLTNYKPDFDLLILDGIPRNVNQAKLLDDHIQVLKVIHLVCKDEEATVQRIRKRALKQNRIDDGREDVIRRRFEVYHEQTQPVIEHYRREIIAEAEADGSPAEVLRNVLRIVEPVQSAHFANALE